MKRILAIGVVAVLLAGVAQGAIIDIPGDAADRSIGTNADGDPVLVWNGQTTLMIGDDNFDYNKGDTCAVMVFALPDIDGEDIISANLSFDIYTAYPGGVNDWPKGIDLYGVRYASSSSVLTSDYAPVGPASVGNGVLLQESVYSYASSANWGWDSGETDASGDNVLALWLGDIYAAGAQGGDFAFLRFNLDKPTANSVQISSANNTEHAIPVLTIETVPEPASLGLLAIGALVAIRRR